MNFLSASPRIDPSFTHASRDKEYHNQPVCHQQKKLEEVSKPIEHDIGIRASSGKPSEESFYKYDEVE
jgi:hypothetical protein